MEDCVLKFRGFPYDWSDLQRATFLHQFGCSAIQFDGPKCVYVLMDNKESACDLLHKLHQFKVEGSRLSVEFAEKCLESSPTFPIDLNWLTPNKCTVTPLLPRFHAKYSYNYPPPNVNVLENILGYLWTNPMFYTTVLDLMKDLGMQNPFLNSATDVARVAIRKNDEFCSENEICPLDLRFYSDKILNQKTQVDDVSDEIPSSSFECARKRKKIEINVRNHENCVEMPDLHENCGEFGQMQKSVDVCIQPMPENEFDFSTVMNSSEIANLKQNQNVTPSDLSLESLNISRRLYVKNLSKKVEEMDLKRLFGAFVNSKDSQSILGFDVRLFTKGRMHEQAFICYHSIEEAVQAYTQCQQIKLIDKIINVQFARSCV